MIHLSLGFGKGGGRSPHSRGFPRNPRNTAEPAEHERRAKPRQALGPLARRLGGRGLDEPGEVHGGESGGRALHGSEGPDWGELRTAAESPHKRVRSCWAFSAVPKPPAELGLVGRANWAA